MKKLTAAIIAGALTMSAAEVAQAGTPIPGEAVGFANGWTTFTPNSCVINPGNRFVIYASASGDKRLATNNPVWSTQLSPFCTDGKKFSVHVTNGVWDSISYSIRLNR